MGAHNDLGKEGELIAKKFLENKGYRILEQNWRQDKFEIDLIAEKDSFLVFTEVKTRSTSVEEVDDVLGDFKEKKLIDSVNAYLDHIEENADCRIDIIIVQKKGTELNVIHLEDAISQR